MSNRNRKKEANKVIIPQRRRFIPDTHGIYDEMVRICDDAIANDLLITCLGDTVDGMEGLTNNAANLAHMLDLLDAGKAEWIMANHEWKHIRALRNMKRYGNYRVHYRDDSEQGLKDIEAVPGLGDRLLARADVTPFWKRIDEKVFIVHASYHPDMEGIDPFWRIKDQHMVGRAIYGQTTGLEDPEGKPERMHDWVADVPEGQVVIVGHDIRQTDYITHYVNKSGGEVYFLDTGCGKKTLTAMYLDYIDGVISSPYPIVTIDFHA